MAAVEKRPLLIADDSEVARYSKGRILRQAGFEVVEAATGGEALHAVGVHKPPLVLLDVNLPDIDGWEVCRRIKADPATASVLVLQMSATYVQQADMVRALEGGADACLTEPVEPPVLIATVKALLRVREAEDAVREALVREQTARAAAEEANRSKDEFLATLSHELRSPLGAILTWATLLRLGTLDAAQTERAAEAIERNARLQVRLIEDLLDVSRIITGKMHLDFRLIDLPSVVDAALDTVRPSAEAKGVSLESVIEPKVGPIMGDADRLQQVVWNLLSNAIKFTPKGGRVAMRLERLGSSARLVVDDTGKGIAPDMLPHVFERFRQADTSSRRSDGGLGLGLAIVRHVTEMHGGTAEASSAGEGQGAKFTIKLPFPSVPATLAPPLRVRGARVSVADAPVLRDLRLLVVDDDPDAREALITVLAHAGAMPVAVDSVQDALAAIAKSAPDLVVSDIAMPGENGYDLIRRIRALPAEHGGRVPALALTAHARSEDRDRVLEAGFQAFLSKPIEPAELLNAVATLARVTRTA